MWCEWSRLRPTTRHLSVYLSSRRFGHAQREKHFRSAQRKNFHYLVYIKWDEKVPLLRFKCTNRVYRLFTHTWNEWVVVLRGASWVTFWAWHIFGCLPVCLSNVFLWVRRRCFFPPTCINMSGIKLEYETIKHSDPKSRFNHLLSIRQ